MNDLKLTEKQQRVASAIWRWQEEGFEKNIPSLRGLRFQALWRVAIMLGMGGIFYFFSMHAASYFVFSTAVLISCAVILSPRGLYLILEKGVESLVKGISFFIQSLVFPLIYFLFFMPYGVLRQKGGGGLIKKTYDKNIASYWQAADQSITRDKQF